MKKQLRLSIALWPANALDKRKKYSSVHYFLVTAFLFFNLLINKNAAAQSYSINTSGALPDSSAMLDIISANKGFLIPRVSLASVTDSTTIAHPAVSLQVYNTNASMTGGDKGFWYWNGTRWVQTIGNLGADSLVVGTDVSSHLYNLQITGNAGITSSLTAPLVIGGKGTASSLTYKTTSGNGTTGADHVFQVGNNGNTEAMRISNSGQIAIGTASPSAGYLLTMNTSSGIAKGLNLTLSGGSGTGINVSSSSSAYNGILVSNSSSSTSTAFNGIGAVLSSANIVSGYAGYRNSSGLSYGFYAINGTTSTYATNVNAWAAFLQGRTVISSESSPTSGLGTDLEIRNTTTGSGNPSTVSLRQTTSNTSNASALANLNFGDNHQTGAQAQIQITRSATGGSGDLPTDMIFSTTPDGSSTLTERTRITNAGNLGVGTGSTVSARVHSVSTTEQLRLGYDASNYYSTTVGSSGAVTFDAAGSGAAFSFSDAVSLANNSTANTQALNDSTTKVATTAFVDRAIAGVSGGSGWGLTGNSGTTDGTHFIGTTDNKPLNIKVNNQKAGRIDNYLANAFWGYQSGNSVSSGYYLTAMGDQALYTNSSGTNNTAFGHQALYYNSTGGYNTSVGDVSLYQNTTGAYNTALGTQSMNYNTTGSFNTAAGMQSLTVNTTGSYNTAIGYNALNSNTTGYQNTGDGFYAGNTNTTGYNSSYFGYNANPSTSALNNATAIGANTTVNATNKVRIGDANVTVIEGQVAFTNVSDGRFKTNITESDVKGLDFIMRLRPVAYNIDTRQFEEFVTRKMPEHIRTRHFENRDFTASTAKRHNGFIAQEVETAAQASGYEFTGLHKPDSEDDNYGLAYSEFVIPLVKAVQEQQKMITEQEQLLKAKDNLLTNMQIQLNQLNQRLQQLESKKE